MWLNWISDGLVVFFLSMLPVTELRGSLPYALGILKMPLIPAFLWSVAGNIAPVAFLLFFLNPIFQFFFKHFSFLEKHTKKYFEKLHHKHTAKFNELGAIFLAIFVAIPLPGTGAWTGALLAYLFSIPFWLAFGSISLGVLGAGIIVAFFSESVIHMASLF